GDFGIRISDFGFWGSHSNPTVPPIPKSEFRNPKSPMTVIALLTLDVHIPHAQSLKDKRMVVRRLKDRLRSKFNVAVSKVNHQDLWQRSQLSVVTVGSDDDYVQQTLKLALEEAEQSTPECVVQGTVEIV